MSEHPLDFLMSRRSTRARDMSEPGPDDEALAKILRVGLRVPDHGRLYPWRFIVLRGEARTRLGEVAARAFRAEDPEAPDKLVEIERGRFERAPIVVAVISRVVKDHPKIPEWEQVLSSGACCQNLLNAAFALGFAAQWLTEWPAYNTEVWRALGLAENERIAGFVYLGSSRVPLDERPRADLADVLSEWSGPDGS